MRGIVRAFAVIYLLFASPFTHGVSAAPGLLTTGTFSPGALVMGRTEPGNTVFHDGNPVHVSGDGHFLMGLGRDVRGTTRVHIQQPGGEASSFSFPVGERRYEVQRIDGLPSAQVTPDPETLARIAAENSLIKQVRRRNSATSGYLSGFVWPVDGTVSGLYGSQRILNGKPRSPHNGVDIAAPAGTPVRAMGRGEVSLVHEDMFYTGKTITIDHGHGLTSIYVHLSDIFVDHGQQVSMGQPIGAVGQTGRATGPHLHWGVTLLSVHLDPLLVVELDGNNLADNTVPE